MRTLQPALRPLLGHPIREAVIEARPVAGCYLVGGAIRDQWVREEIVPDRTSPVDRDSVADRDQVVDWDLVVDGAADLAARLARDLPARLVALGGDRFPVHRLVTDSYRIDLQEPLGGDLQRELERRDLTINSIAIDLRTAELIDPVGGVRDLEARILRADSPTAFSDDPLRVLRLLRFAHSLPEFEIEDATQALARDSAAELSGVASERVREELGVVLAIPGGPRLGPLLDRLDLYPRLWSSTWPAAAHTATKPTETPDLAELDRIMAAIDEASGSRDDGDRLATLRHGALLASLSDSASNRVVSRHLLERGWIARATARRLERLPTLGEPPRDERECRLYIHGFREDWPVAAALQTWLAGAGGGQRARWSTAIGALSEVMRTSGDEVLSRRPLLDGREVQRELGLAPGPELGRVLDRLEIARAEGSVRSAEEARSWLRDELGKETGGDAGRRRPT